MNWVGEDRMERSRTEDSEELESDGTHRLSVMLLSTPMKSVGCLSPDESPGLKTTSFLEIISIPVTNFSCHGRAQGYFVDNDIYCRVSYQHFLFQFYFSFFFFKFLKKVLVIDRARKFTFLDSIF